MAQRIAASKTVGSFGTAGVSLGPFVRTTAGLLIFDDFNRSNQVGMGNGWLLGDSGSHDIVSNRVSEVTNNTEAMAYRELSHAADFLVQANIRVDASLAACGFLVRAGGNGGINTWTGYYVRVEKWTNDYRFSRATSPGNNGSALVTAADAAIDTTNYRMLRFVGEVSGGNLLLRMYGTGDLADSTILTVDPTARGAEYSHSSPDTGTQIGLHTWRGGLYDNFILCGRNIVVNNLPTGWKVKVDSRSAVVESDGVATINVDLWALPATTIVVQDATSVEQYTLTPSDGIYGGDIYSL